MAWPFDPDPPTYLRIWAVRVTWQHPPVAREFVIAGTTDEQSTMYEVSKRVNILMNKGKLPRNNPDSVAHRPAQELIMWARGLIKEALERAQHDARHA